MPPSGEPTPRDETTVTYYADLAAELRERRCTEAETLDALRSVKEASEAGATTPTTEFGEPADYAASFSGSRRFTVTQLVRAGAFAASIVILVALRLTVLRDVELLPWGVLQGIVVFVTIGLVGDIVARRLRRRMPSGFVADPR